MPRLPLLVLAACVAALAQDNSPKNLDDVLDRGITIPWRDDAMGHPDLLAFRERLTRAALQHNSKAIVEAADPDFRGCDMRGIAGLRDFLKGQPWSSLLDALAEGGVLSADGESFDSNYAVWLFPERKTGVAGPESFSVIKDANVAVFEAPRATSRLLARLSYRLVVPQGPVIESAKGTAARSQTERNARQRSGGAPDTVPVLRVSPQSRWQRIEYGRGKAGYVLSRNLIDPAGMSVRMRRKQGKWRLTGIATYCD